MLYQLRTQGKSYNNKVYFSTPLSLSKDQQIKQLELELDQERRMAESLIEDMVNYNKHNYVTSDSYKC